MGRFLFIFKGGTGDTCAPGKITDPTAAHGLKPGFSAWSASLHVVRNEAPTRSRFNKKALQVRVTLGVTGKFGLRAGGASDRLGRGRRRLGRRGPQSVPAASGGPLARAAAPGRARAGPCPRSWLAAEASKPPPCTADRGQRQPDLDSESTPLLGTSAAPLEQWQPGAATCTAPVTHGLGPPRAGHRRRLRRDLLGHGR